MNPGWIDPDLRAEHPELRVWTAPAPGGRGRSSDGVREQLRRLSDRFSGPQAVALRTKPVPHAYRVFFRHIGLDPDVEGSRTPVEEVALERLKRGRFVPGDRVADALTLAVIETAVGVWALDEGTLDGDLGLRPAREGEPLGRGAGSYPLPAGNLVVADGAGPVALLFGDVARAHEVGRTTARIRLFAIQVAGVAMVQVDEALWIAAEALEG